MTEKSLFLKKVENIVGKGENAGYQHFLLFPQCFQKVSFSSKVLKVWIVWERVNFAGALLVVAHKMDRWKLWSLNGFKSPFLRVINPLPDDKFWILPNWNWVCRRQFWILWKWQKVIQTVRKHCGKRRNCLLRAISPFPTVFSKDFYYRLVKTRACLGKG